MAHGGVAPLDPPSPGGEPEIESAPWSASAMAQKGLLLEEAGRLSEAEGYIVLAMEREPTNWRYPLLRARSLGQAR